MSGIMCSTWAVYAKCVVQECSFNLAALYWTPRRKICLESVEETWITLPQSIFTCLKSMMKTAQECMKSFPSLK